MGIVKKEKKGEEGRRRECPDEATPNNQSSVKLLKTNRMPLQFRRKPTDKIYGYTYKRKTQMSNVVKINGAHIVITPSW